VQRDRNRGREHRDRRLHARRHHHAGQIDADDVEQLVEVQAQAQAGHARQVASRRQLPCRGPRREHQPGARVCTGRALPPRPRARVPLRDEQAAPQRARRTLTVSTRRVAAAAVALPGGVPCRGCTSAGRTGRSVGDGAHDGRGDGLPRLRGRRPRLTTGTCVSQRVADAQEPLELSGRRAAAALGQGRRGRAPARILSGGRPARRPGSAGCSSGRRSRRRRQSA